MLDKIINGQTDLVIDYVAQGNSVNSADTFG
jgi:hypothetical protein